MSEHGVPLKMMTKQPVLGCHGPPLGLWYPFHHFATGPEATTLPANSSAAPTNTADAEEDAP